MQVSNANNVKIYNLSAGKSLPEVNILILSICEFQNTVDLLVLARTPPGVAPIDFQYIFHFVLEYWVATPSETVCTFE